MWVYRDDSQLKHTCEVFQMFTVESALSGSAGCMSMSYQLSNIISITLYTHRDFLVAQTVRNLPAVQETQVQSLGWEDPLEKGMTTHSSILAWRIPWTEEPGGLQSMGSQRVEHD